MDESEITEIYFNSSTEEMLLLDEEQSASIHCFVSSWGEKDV